MSAPRAWQPRDAGPALVRLDSRDSFARQHAFLHGLASRTTASVFQEVLSQVVDFVASVVPCDSCFIYILEGEDLVLCASKNPHPEAINRLRLKVGQGITGWVAQHREPVAVPRRAFADARFRVFSELPEDRFEAFLSVPLLSRGKLVGVLNLQNLAAHDYSEREITLISSVGFLVGAEIEIAHLEKQNSELAGRLESRKLVERAKGILQQEMHLSEPEAYAVLQKQSQTSRKSMKDIAEAIVLTYSVVRGSAASEAG